METKEVVNSEDLELLEEQSQKKEVTKLVGVLAILVAITIILYSSPKTIEQAPNFTDTISISKTTQIASDMLLK